MSRKNKIVVPITEPAAVEPIAEPVAVSAIGVAVRNTRKGGGKVSILGITIDEGGCATFGKDARLDYAVQIGLVEYVTN
jgi:hypothetical protein